MKIADIVMSDPDQKVLQIAAKVNLSKHTVQRQLKEQSLQKWMKARVPALRPADAAQQLRWCIDHKN